jgi:hypothetical protein
MVRALFICAGAALIAVSGWFAYVSRQSSQSGASTESAMLGKAASFLMAVGAVVLLLAIIN